MAYLSSQHRPLILPAHGVVVSEADSTLPNKQSVRTNACVYYLNSSNSDGKKNKNNITIKINGVTHFIINSSQA